MGKIEIPEGWFVFECGQSPVHMLWFCHLMKLEAEPNGKRKFVWTEEFDSFEEALRDGIHKINMNQTSCHEAD